jgi:probable F420-dependent oxidoreductase
MDVGVAIPTCKEGLSSPVGFARPEQVIEVIVRAEALGYHSVWGNDHITAPQYVRERYPDPPSFYEPLVVLAAAAGVTRRIRLATATIVLPLREPVFLAKQVATLDRFCGGRVILGVGTGAYREEFERLFPRLRAARRADMAEESLTILRRLFTERMVSHEGRYYAFDGLDLAPPPIQRPLPIFVGGNHPAVVERAARHGDGWLPASVGRDTLARGVARLREAAVEVGRDPAGIAVAPQLICAIAPTHEAAVAKFRASWMYQHLRSLTASTLRDQNMARLEEYNLVGAPDELIERIGLLRAAGVTMLAATNFVGSTVGEWLDDMQYFAEAVVPALGAGGPDRA